MTQALAVPEAAAAAAAQDDQEQEVLTRVRAVQAAAVDVIGDTRALRADLGNVAEGDAPARERVRLVMDTPQGRLGLALNDLAHQQLAAKVGIPAPYYDRMLAGAPALLVENLNTWLRSEPDRRLLRLTRPLTDADGAGLARVGATMTLRAVLSASYRPINHAAVVDTVLPVAQANGLRIHEWHLNDKHFFLRFVGVERDVYEVARAYREAHPGVGHAMDLHELVQFGASIRNSETGQGSYAIESLIKVMWCVNTATKTESRVRHVGGRNDDEEQMFQADTKRLDDAAVLLKARDALVAVLSDGNATRIAEQIAAAKGHALELPAEVPMFDFVANVGARFDLRQGELDLLKEEVAHELSRGQTGGRLTPFVISQGLTATAKRIGAGNGEPADFERKMELEHAGWQVIEDPVAALLKAGTTPAKPSKN